MQKAYNASATGQIGALGAKKMIGFYVNSTSGGTIVFRDGNENGRVLSGTITPAVGFHPFPAGCISGVHATIGATLNVSVFVDE